MLSGFVIAHAYDEKLHSGQLDVRAFVSIRVARLYSVYALALIFSFAVELWNVPVQGSGRLIELTVSALLALLFLPSTVTGSPFLFPLNLCFWSLFAELVFNALYAFKHRFLTNAVLLAIIGISAAMLVAIAVKSGKVDHGYGFSALSAGAGLGRVDI